MVDHFVGQSMRFAKALCLALCLLVAASARGAQLVGEIPFELVHNSVVAKISFTGQPSCDVLVDTGADPSMIDLSTAKSFGLPISSKGFAGEGGGNQASIAYPTVLRDFQLGTMVIHRVDAVAIDLSAPSQGLGQKLCGVLGYSVLKRQIVQFDYPHQKVRFLLHAAAIGPDAIVLHFRYAGDLLVKGLKVNGHPVIANFDTGSNGNFQLTADAAQRLMLQADLDVSVPSGSTGFNGKTANRSGRVAQITVGTEVIPSPEVTFYGAHTGRDNVRWDIRVGNDFLKNYRVTFDFTKSLIILDRPQVEAIPLAF